jgi:hypothetical protein
MIMKNGFSVDYGMSCVTLSYINIFAYFITLHFGSWLIFWQKKPCFWTFETEMQCFFLLLDSREMAKSMFEAELSIITREEKHHKVPGTT